MNRTQIQETLVRLQRQPTRSLGQNFLHDRNMARWIARQTGLEPGEAWLEIGPGLGALTEHLLEISANGMVVEKDGKLAEFLQERFPELPTIHGDAVEFDPRRLFPRGPVRIVGNLPYYVSSQLLLNFALPPSPARTLTFTLQKELAQRLSAPPRTKDFGGLTVMLGYRWKVEYVRTLGPQLFIPAPNVDSAVVHLTLRPAGELPDCDEQALTALVKRGFSQRRKQLRNLLELEHWEDLARELGIGEQARAEELSVLDWVRLTNAVSGIRGDEPGQDVHGEMFDIVDANDRILGTASRAEAHAKELLHRAVHIFVFNTAGDLFLQRRSRRKDKSPLAWDSSAAGHVNSGDTYDSTAPRELIEELGVTTPVTRTAVLKPSAETGWEHVHLYEAQHDGPFRLNPAEIDSGGFFPLPLIREWIANRPNDFASGFIACWRAWESRNGASQASSSASDSEQ
jgi:16S rRNA (adenine1518-N6/adenine1519-N6)-dimethyltransferase